MKTYSTRWIILSLAATSLLICVHSVAVAKSNDGPLSAAPELEEPMERLIRDLSSSDDERRLTATQLILNAGEIALKPLREAGARQVSPNKNESLRRIDMVYSLIDGLKLHGKSGPDKIVQVRPNEIGLDLKDGVTKVDIERMGQQYGFRETRNFSHAPRPQVKVRLI